MGWTKVCGTAKLGIWVLKGNARARMFPANLDHLRVEWKKQGSYETAWVTPGVVVWMLVVWMLHNGGARHPGPGVRYFSLVSFRLNLSMWWVVDLWGFGVGFVCSVPGAS